MKKLNTISILKKFFSTSKSETYILISGGLACFFIVFILNSILGIYSIFGISNDLSENLRGIDLARKAQVALHGQILAWENILLSGNRYSEFRKNYHEFSQRSESVGNILFNLKLQNSGEENIARDIEKLLIMHKKLTSQFTIHIVEMEEKKFTNVQEKIHITNGLEDGLLGSLNKIAEKTEKTGYNKSSSIIIRYMVIAVASSIVLIILLVYYGKQIGARLLKTHDTLENLVQNRTRDYIEANLSLKKEIEQHKITEKKLIMSRNEIEEKNQLLIVSEKKYRYIVEGTKDIIFTLDDKWFFKTANDAIKTELKISPGAVSGYRLTDFIHDEFSDVTMAQRLVMEKLEAARKENKRIKFNAQFQTPDLIEPVEYKVNLEFIEIEGTSEIIGKAVRVSDERLSDAFVSEKCEYRIKNLLFAADDISHRITGNLQKYLEKSDVSMIRLGIREILINSIEHGNLNISFEEKSEAIMNDRYFEFINERQKEPEFRDRFIKIEYMISPSKAIYKISDQGRGFNHRKHMSMKEESMGDLNERGAMHGRGIVMAKKIFNEVKYNIKGNQVLLVKYINCSVNPGENETSIEYAGFQNTQVS